MKTLKIFLILCVIGQVAQAQKYITQNGVISFFSSTPVEDIEAINNQVSAVLNSENGDIAAVLLMKAFNFEKALMQEHFNEKFVESDKYPKSTFKGQILEFSTLELNENQTQVKLVGDLTIHGVTKRIEADGTLSQKGLALVLQVEFQVEVADYDIKIPGTVKEKIAKYLKVNARFEMNKM